MRTRSLKEKLFCSLSYCSVYWHDFCLLKHTYTPLSWSYWFWKCFVFFPIKTLDFSYIIFQVLHVRAHRTESKSQKCYQQQEQILLTCLQEVLLLVGLVIRGILFKCCIWKASQPRAVPTWCFPRCYAGSPSRPSWSSVSQSPLLLMLRLPLTSTRIRAGPWSGMRHALMYEHPWGHHCIYKPAGSTFD